MRGWNLSVLKSRRGLLSLAIAGVCGLVAAQSAHATLILTLNETGYAPMSITDSGDNGQVIFFGSYGDFTTNIVTGFTNITVGDTSSAYLQLQSLDVTNNSTSPSPKTLMVSLQETTPFTFPGTPSSNVFLSSAASGTLTPQSSSDKITFQSFATPTSGTVTSGLQSYTAASSGAGTTHFSVPDANASFIRTASFGLESDLSLTLGNLSEASNVSGTATVTTQNPVPEPVSGMMLAFAGGFALVRRPKRA